MIIAKFVSIIFLGYLLGSIPFGVLIGKQIIKGDIRNYGSGKMGATNVLRTAGKKAAGMVALLDVSKGALAAIFAGLIMGNEYLAIGGFSLTVPFAQVSATLAAVAGHIWPVFLGFRGGRGVATFMGGLIALCPPAALFGGEVAIITAGLTKYVSLGSIMGAVGTYVIMVPLIVLNGFPIAYLIYTLTGAIVIIVMHKDNINRLLQGTERRLGEKAERRETSLLS